MVRRLFIVFCSSLGELSRQSIKNSRHFTGRLHLSTVTYINPKVKNHSYLVLYISICLLIDFGKREGACKRGNMQQRLRTWRDRQYHNVLLDYSDFSQQLASANYSQEAIESEGIFVILSHRSCSNSYILCCIVVCEFVFVFVSVYLFVCVQGNVH